LEKAVDDRFDRRELLLHVGDVLEALSRVAGTGRPDASVAQLFKDEKSLHGFAFLRGLAPTINAAEFGKRAASAYSRWPKDLLEEELNRDALASSVQHDLFGGNPEGWKVYVAHIRQNVKWFASGLPEMQSQEVTQKTLHDTPESVDSAEKSTDAAATSEWGASDEKRGWPWPQPGSTS
jgi:hypothetical protein